MFKMITWPQYLGTVAALLVLYYAYVAIMYYRVEITALAKGKGKLASKEVGATLATPASLLSRGSLIARPAVAVPPPAAAEQKPEEDQQEEEVSEETTEEAEKEDASTTMVEAVEKKQNDKSISFSYNNEKIIKFTKDNDGGATPAPATAPETTTDDSEQGFTIGVAQLGEYFQRAAERELTQEQLVEEAPELENTAVLMAFFQNSTKAAQQLTATLYAETPEPASN